LTASYASFFNGGSRVAPHGIEAATLDREPLTLAAPERRAVVDPDLAAMMARMLTAVVACGTGRAAALPGRQVAGKTGTTQDNRDAWFIGCVDGRLIGVWIGNDDGMPMRGVMGGGLPATLFRQVAGALR
jgi:penicillin-binding protein 1A